MVEIEKEEVKIIICKCKGTIMLNDSKKTILHSVPECEEFKQIVNAYGNHEVSLVYVERIEKINEN